MAVQTRSRRASIALEQPLEEKTTPKLKAKTKATSSKRKLADSCDTAESPPIKKPRTPKTKEAKIIEKRLRRFRKHAPKNYTDRLERAQSQRMFVIDRISGTSDDSPEETIELAGTTGNVYSITVTKVPSCTCPDNLKGNQCKHIIYVLHNVLKAPAHLQYQLAFLSHKLVEIFSNAPLPPSQNSATQADPNHPSNRKVIDGDCPICFTEFEPDTEEIVWCKAACGNNIHQTCFEQWAKSQAGKGVKCVYCRTPWRGDEDLVKKVKDRGQVNSEGYVNVGAELGLPGVRDMSTYNPYWVRRTFGREWSDYSDDD